MPNFASIPFAFYVQAAFSLLLVLAIIVAILNLHDYFTRKKLNKLEEELINKNLDKNFGFLHETIQQTQAKINQAEDMEIKTLETSRENIERFEGEYKAKLEQTIKEAQEMIVEGNKKTATEVVESFNFYKSSLEQFNKEIEQNMGQLKNQIITSQGDFVGFLKELKDKSEKSQTISEEEAKERIDKVFNGVEDRISDYLIKSEQRMMMAIELELKSARQLIDTYKVQQLQIIDENIVAILEKTINLVLREKMSLKDQLDLVYQSLEKAKADKIIV